MGILDIFGSPEQAASPNEAWLGWQRVDRGLQFLIQSLEQEFGPEIQADNMPASAEVVPIDPARSARNETAQRVIDETVIGQQSEEARIYHLTQRARREADRNPVEGIDELAA